jgi:hypothetical protein
MMDNELRYPLTDLTAGSMLRLCDGKGRAIVVFEGQVWITQDADQRDFVLGRGESFSVDHQGLTLVEALRDSKLLLVDAQPDAAPDSYALYRQARELRAAVLAAMVRRGVLALRSTAARLVARALAARPAPTPTLCTAAR